MNRNILNQPFPLNTKISWKFLVAGCFGVFVALFLFVFKPFEMNTLEPGWMLFCAIAYGLITFSCIIFMLLVLPLVFPAVFTEERWTVGKEILLTSCAVLLIGIMNYLFSYFLIGASLTISNFFWILFITASIGIIPIVIFILFQQNQQLKKYSAEAATLQSKIAEMNKEETINSFKAAKISDAERIILKGDYQKELVDVKVNDLIYVTSANNYVKVYYFENDKVVYSILRITMKKVEDALLPYPNFFRCHRAYLINLYRVKEVTGNAQGYKIKLEEVEEVIPVSRNLNGEFSDKVLSKRN